MGASAVTHPFSLARSSSGWRRRCAAPPMTLRLILLPPRSAVDAAQNREPAPKLYPELSRQLRTLGVALDRQERRFKRHRPIVYYMRMDRLVKIGTTIDIAKRVAA